MHVTTKMVSCCVPDCYNYSAKTKKAGDKVTYHRIPQDDPQRTKAWLERIRRKNMPPLENCYVCSDHFQPSCFKTDLRAQLLTGEKPKMSLKDDAIPSLFSMAQKRKIRDYRANVAFNDKDVKKLVLIVYLYFTFYKFTSLA